MPPGTPGNSTGMAMPAGSTPPFVDRFEDVAGAVHAIDGDGTALCSIPEDVAAVDHFCWAEVPRAQRCPVCALILDGAGAGR